VNGLLLDTHIWIWFQLGDSTKISASVRRELETSQQVSRLFLSAVSVLEVARLVMEGTVDLGQSIDHFVNIAEHAPGFEIILLRHRILIESTRLPGTIHRDPSDRIIVATAREHGLTLITRDKEILAYAKQGHLNARKP